MNDAKPASPLERRPGVYALIDRLEAGPRVVYRDDEIEAADLLAAIESAPKRARRLRLLDTGRFDVPDLERVLESGAPLLTSDEARADPWALEVLLKAAARGGAWIADLVNGPLSEEAAISADAVVRLAADGLDVHVSNRTLRREAEVLLRLAEASRHGRGFCVYYHHGPLAPGLIDIAAAGAWIHVTDASFGPDHDAALRDDLAAGAGRGRGGLAVHIGRGLPLVIAESLFEAGAVLLFKTPPADYRSRFRSLERRARRRILPERASYIQTEFLP